MSVAARVCLYKYKTCIKLKKINIGSGVASTWGPPRLKIWGVQVNCNYKVTVTEMYVYYRCQPGRAECGSGRARAEFF